LLVFQRFAFFLNSGSCVHDELSMYALILGGQYMRLTHTTISDLVVLQKKNPSLLCPKIQHFNTVTSPGVLKLTVYQCRLHQEADCCICVHKCYFLLKMSPKYKETLTVAY
jgi:hypothetical protein